MNKFFKFAFPVLLAILATVAIILGIQKRHLSDRVTELEKEITGSEVNTGMSEGEVIAFAKADSLLLSGNYNEAIATYKNLDTGNNPSLKNLRIGVAEEFINLQNRSRRLARMAADTTGTEVDYGDMPETEQMDSLSFALEKAQLQLSNLKRQMIEKSFGEYITFKSTKGNRLFYVGEVDNGKADGFGIAILDSGSRYEGEWESNKRHGQGSFYWIDGEHYEGDYKNDQRSGTGTYYWPNGEKYVGHWKNDMRNGEGKFYGKDGELMTQGVWKDDKLVEER